MTESQIKKAFESDRNLFITGAAGTGKSYILNEYIQTVENVIIAAPTGIAALHLGGDTMHKVFHIPVPAFDSPSFAKGKKGAITNAQLKVIAEADVIIIDEISMALNSVFRFAIKVIRKAEKLKGSKIRIIVCGDFCQLPPVVKKTDLKLMKKFGLHESGYPFTTQEWKSCNFKVIELTEVKRQNDVEFINELNKIRVGEDANIDYFNQFVNPNANLDDYIVICGTNTEADRINREYLDALPGTVAVFQSEKSGRCSAGMIDDIIIVKEGAKIIFTSNDSIYGKYKNGSFGIIKKFNSKSVTVEIDGKDVDVFQQEYKLYSYSATGGHLNKKEIGCIKQYPFKLGKAITIHKSQGQTFEKVAISPEIFASGQLYVALSRVKGPDGLVILKEIEPDALIIDETVAKFIRDGYTWSGKIPVKKSATKKATSSAKKTSKVVTKTSKSKATKTTKAIKVTTKSKITKPKTKTKSSTKTVTKKPVKKVSTTRLTSRSSSTKKQISVKKPAKK